MTDETKNKIFDEIKKWKKLGNDRVDVLITTPLRQGMSVANLLVAAWAHF
ncbi:MAG: hypothetical protein U0L05_09150 [Schaedlerella sp.]|nr:hypothetical protein [Schaedlerella sp.]